ncbi:MAG: universal stress protein [Candidatus Edwardsbacteria bacterium]|nr:universal stress protein [Candidatus Edwardsbacteria bacterium]
MERQMLVCFDAAQSGPRVLEAGKRLSRLLKMRMVVIHVRERPEGISGYYDELFRDNPQRIEERFEGAARDDLLFIKSYFSGEKKRPRFKMATGNPAELILQELASGDYALVVIGTKDGKNDGEPGGRSSRDRR